MRERLPSERRGITHRFIIDGAHKGYITVGMYEDGRPGEIFIVMSKEGSATSGFLDTIAVQTSMLLQHGVSLNDLVRKHINSRFEPYGRTNNQCIETTTSIVDYVFRWLGMKFLTLEELTEIGIVTRCHECGKAVKCGEYSRACTAPAELRLISSR